ncbi:MAG TPA: Rrf2 family transcriptional regulator [Chthonomonadaceae bacterium]|nr:Rrf2 family transcriptional regulator [Chthonomonadaceae bacterium]
MLSLSKKTDYALLALSYLTRTEPGRAVNTKEIAERYAIPMELLAKILQKLARADLLLSTPGPTGGYRLARSADQISVGEVIKVIDGPPAIIHCLKIAHNGCEQLDRCTIRRPLARINAKILQMLDLISLAEINRDEEGESAAITFMAGREPQARHRETARM